MTRGIAKIAILHIAFWLPLTFATTVRSQACSTGHNKHIACAAEASFVVAMFLCLIRYCRASEAKRSGGVAQLLEQ